MRFILIWIKTNKKSPTDIRWKTDSSAIIELIDIDIRIDVILRQLLYTHINTHTPVSLL